MRRLWLVVVHCRIMESCKASVPFPSVRLFVCQYTQTHSPEVSTCHTRDTCFNSVLHLVLSQPSSPKCLGSYMLYRLSLLTNNSVSEKVI